MIEEESGRNAMAGHKCAESQRGFTLLELGIVLVIIGLVVGAVLVGRDLIGAAYVRAQITQIEKFNTVVNTFYGKYGALPGDLNQQVASTFGFSARGQGAGEGDGNGVIEGLSWPALGGSAGWSEAIGETGMFWEDLTYANGLNINMIEGSFNSAPIASYTGPGGGASISGTRIGQYMPAAKIGGGNYVYVWSGGPLCGNTPSYNSINYFGLSATYNIDNNGAMESNPGISVKQAYAIDAKIDDGNPQSGRVIAAYIGNFWPNWTGACDYSNTASYGAATFATVGSAATCYDNSAAISGTPGVGGAAQHYSLEMNNGAGVNCALSFRMQGGD